jgi:hypothetical protein
MNDPAIPAPTPDLPPAETGAIPPANAPIVVPDSGPEYEFTEPQNAVLDDLARGILWVRIPLFIVGVLQIVFAVGLAFRLRQDGAHIIGILGHIMVGIVCFLLASWLLRAAAAFSRVTHTTGRDITNLMIGLRNLAVWFDMLAFFVKLYVIMLGILLVVLLIGLFGGAFRGAS